MHFLVCTDALKCVSVYEYMSVCLKSVRKSWREKGCLDQFQGRAEGSGRGSEWISVGIKVVKEQYYLSIFVWWFMEGGMVSGSHSLR